VPGDGPDAGGRTTALMRTAYLLTGDRAAAEDLALAVLVAGGPAVQDHRRLVTEHLRRSRRAMVGEATAAFTWPGPARSAAPDPGPVAAALTRLPPRTRAVLVLRYGEDLPDEVVGPAVGRPVAAVAGLAGEGLARLGELLGETDVEAALRRDLARRAAEVDGSPAGLLDRVREDRRARHRHRAGLVALAAVLVAVVLLVLLSVG
jgi:hypothetical protein